VDLVDIIFPLLNGGGMAGGPVQEEKGRPGGPVQKFSDVGGRGGGSVLSACSGRDLLESVKHHYAQETTSPSSILCFTRRIFYFFSFE
jgi:hypothetical protein